MLCSLVDEPAMSTADLGRLFEGPSQPCGEDPAGRAVADGPHLRAPAAHFRVRPDLFIA